MPKSKGNMAKYRTIWQNIKRYGKISNDMAKYRDDMAKYKNNIATLMTI